MATDMGIEEGRGKLGNIANLAEYAGQVTYLTRNGRRIAAVVPLEIAHRGICAPVKEYDLYIVRGEQPDANGKEFGESGIEVPAEVHDWMTANGVDFTRDPDVWVLVTPADEHPGELRNLIAHREVTA